MSPRRFVLAASVLAFAAAVALTPAAQEAGARPEQPRFRAGANLVRLDAYVSVNGQPVTDLTVSDFEVLEDGAPQKVESFEFIRPRGPVAQSARVEPTTVAESREMAADPSARLFVLFLDVWHVHIEGSFKAQNPVINMLDRVIGQDDLIGVMTPDMSARNLTLARRTTGIEAILRNNWYWGERQKVNTSDPRERELQMCYADAPGSKTEGIAQDLIDRRRERKTLDAIEDLIIHLEGLREERKFVVLLSEGWRLPRRDDRLANVVNGVPGIEGLRVGAGGRPTNGPATGDQSFESCERERMRLASEDLEQDFRTLLQRANRANVSFYTVDPRGLVVFDEDLSLRRATNITADRGRLNARQNSLRELAENTDGVAVVNTNNLDAALTRMLSDVGSYYLLGYYSTNPKLDGRFRKLTVRIKRPGVDVRARPGYLAPTEEEAAAARAVTANANGSDRAPELKRALESLGSARATLPLRVQTAANASHMWITAELDAATVKSAEWQQGGRLRVVIEHERGAAPPIEREMTLEPGQRAARLLESAASTLAPGRYVVRLSLTGAAGTLPLQVTADVTVPASEALVGSNGIASRRGPATGLQYHPTADGRYQRTERIRFELPRLATGGIVSGRVLSRNGQPHPLTVSLSERIDEALKTPLIVADLTLAPLAQGEYVLEIVVEKDGKKNVATYGFRIVP
jgi:VWFA-related protein